jgi:CelD/BcsL family acetyltransferase involved in cellulose biosynthesis
MDLRVSTITRAEDLAPLTGRWRDLAARAGNDLPFLLPEWSTAWWDVLREQRRLVRDALHVKVVERPSGELVAVLPLIRTERPGFGPVRARALDFIGADPYITEQRAPIVDPACAAEAGAALAQDLLRDHAWDWIAWRGLDRHGAFASAIDRVLPMRWGQSQAGNVLALQPTWDAFKSGLKRNIKESLRHGYNSLAREGLALELKVDRTPSEVRDGLETFYRLHAMRAQLAGTVDHPDRFASPHARRFLGRVCDQLAERGMAIVFTLNVGGNAVAARVGFIVSECLYLYYSGFDPALGKYGVMTTTVAEAIKHAIGRGLKRVHLSMGTDVSKSRWGPATPMHHDALSIKPRVASRAVYEVFDRASQEVARRQGLARLLRRQRFQ